MSWVGFLSNLATVLSVSIGEYHNAFTDSEGLLFNLERQFFPGSSCSGSEC